MTQAGAWSGEHCGATLLAGREEPKRSPQVPQLMLWCWLFRIDAGCQIWVGWRVGIDLRPVRCDADRCAGARVWSAFMAGNLEVDVSSAVIEYRPTVGELRAEAAGHISVSALLDAAPRRTFVWYVGQRNYPGTYWSVTEQGHVIYESRLELSALLVCDFDRAVQRIKAQPFQLAVQIDGRTNRHTPDFLLSTPDATVVIDVVRKKRLAEPKIQRLCEWTRMVTRSLSWDYRIMSELPPMFLVNIRFLAGYRREEIIDRETLGLVRAGADELVGMRFDDAERRLAAKRPKPLVRSALLHALWCQDFHIDLGQQLRPSTLLEEPR
jgi:hypothetical protein